MNKINGRVIYNRVLGKICFLKILYKNKFFDIIAKYDYYVGDNYNDVKRIRKNYYVEFEIKKINEDIVIINIDNIIKYENSFFISQRQIDILRARNFINYCIRDFFKIKGLIEVNLPILLYGDYKTSGLSLQVFDNKSRLTESSILYSHVYSFQLGSVYSFQRCFRSEKSKTNRHLTEFEMLEVSLLNFDMEDTMNFIEEMIKYIIKSLLNSEYKKLVNINAVDLLKKKFDREDYCEVIKKTGVKPGKGLGKYDRKIPGNIPVFIKNYPAGIASWTNKDIKNRESTLKRKVNFNLLVPIVGELIEGGFKETNRKIIDRKLKISKMDKYINWYLNMMPFSDIKLSGFGMGIERLMMWLFGIKNIRENYIFYRDLKYSEMRHNKI